MGGVVLPLKLTKKRRSEYNDKLEINGNIILPYYRNFI